MKKKKSQVWLIKNKTVSEPVANWRDPWAHRLMTVWQPLNHARFDHKKLTAIFTISRPGLIGGQPPHSTALLFQDHLALEIHRKRFSLISVFPWRNLQVQNRDPSLRRSHICSALPGRMQVGPRLCLLCILLRYPGLLHVRHHPKSLLGHCGSKDTTVWRVHSVNNYSSSSTRCAPVCVNYNTELSNWWK